MFKKRRYVLFVVILMYATLIGILVAAESGVEGSSIHGIGDAIWYSVVTLTTVGYGDLFPVTATGRVIGIVLVLCSLGLLSAIITGVFTTFTGFTLPLYRLRSYRKNQWHVFRHDTEPARVMASELLKEQPDSVCIFFEKKEFRAITEEGDATRKIFYVEGSFRWLLSLHKGYEGINVFCFGENGWDNYRDARRLSNPYRIPIYCLTQVKTDHEIHDLKLFDPNEGLGRFYWRKFPVRQKEKLFIIVGCNRIGGNLFERGLQTNVFGPSRGIHYIVAGDSSDFRKMHYRMCSEVNPAPDKLSFYDNIWDVDPTMIQKADRIIICYDTEAQNLSIYQKLITHYPIDGQVHVYTNSRLQRTHTRTFGHLNEIYTPALVMQDIRSELAKKMHELYQKSGVKETPSWKNLTEFQKQSNIAAADHILVKCRILLGDKKFDTLGKRGLKPVLTEAAKIYETECQNPVKRKQFRVIEHFRWMRFLTLYNWQYNETHDAVKRWNPLLMPYEELPENVLAKDDNAWELIGKVYGE